MYNNFSENYEYDECTARGACSVPPSVSAIQETLLVIIRQSAFYICKLKSLEKSTECEDNQIINMFADVAASTAYTDMQLCGMINTAYNILNVLRKRYQDKCKSLNLPKSDLKDKLYIKPEVTLAQIIAIGEQYFHKKYKSMTQDKKLYSDLLVNIIKNTSESLIQLLDYAKTDSDTTDLILNALNMLNKSKVSDSDYLYYIENLNKKNIHILERLYRIQKENFGIITETEVSLSTKKGKAILVSGSNLNDLYSLLEFTKNEEIDIYTHDNLIIAHAFEKFKNYKNLKGNFGSCKENCILDFALFPGAILITKNSNINTEYLYRGRIFTTAKIVPKGIAQIKNNDFSELIKSASEAKGFAKDKDKPSEVVGISQHSLDEYFRTIAEKLNKKELTGIIIFDSFGYNTDLYDAIAKKTSNKAAILSFSYNIGNIKNSLTINTGYNQGFIWKVLNTLNKYITLNDDDIYYCFSKCDSRTISNMIHLNLIGAKNIYLTNCSPNSINPSLKNFITKHFNIKTLSENNIQASDLFSSD